MRDNKDNMIELLEASKVDNVFSSLIRLKINVETLNLRFGIDSDDYGRLKRILEFRPYENTGVAQYQYYFSLSYHNDPDNSELAFISVRVEQLKKHKQYEFSLSKKYISNLIWINNLTDKKEVEQLIV